jgi:hypothetical protein
VGHIILLGDSIFDNARYVPGGPSVIDHLRRALPRGWRATLLAVDGSVAADVAEQLDRLPADATHLVVSAGGNDALTHTGTILFGTAVSFAEVLTRLADIRADFQREYRAMLQAVLARGLPVVACTVYDAIPGIGPAEQVGLCLFNDVILREAFRAGVPVIELRLVCTDAADYAKPSPIEPSAAGGGKIARAVSRAIAALGERRRGCAVFGVEEA